MLQPLGESQFLKSNTPLNILFQIKKTNQIPLTFAEFLRTL